MRRFQALELFMTALTPLIQRIRAPIEIEQLDVVLDSVEDDFRGAYTALNHQIRPFSHR